MPSTARALSRLSDARARLRTLDDGEVVEAFVQGDERAFQELVLRYQTRLINFVHRTIGDKETAEDLVQETFLRIYRHASRFETTKKFSTWAYTIAHNLAKNELRNRKRSRIVLFQAMRSKDEEDDRPLQFEDSRGRPDNVLHKKSLRELVERTVAALPTHHRTVFVLRDIEGKKYDEIAEIIGCNLGTVKSRLNRARNAFAALIEPALG